MNCFRYLLVFCALIFLYTGLPAQSLKKGEFTANVYYGLGLTKTLVKAYTKPEQKNVQYDATGPMGFMAEYAIVDRVGIGLEYNHTFGEISFEEFNQTQGLNFAYKFNFKINRIQFRTNLHLTKGPNFDFYCLIALGFTAYKASYLTDNPYYIPDFKLSYAVPGMKIGLGFRYFVTKNVGLHAEAALLAPLICGGVSVRF